ncbi:MAG: glycosyltransferase [bacterium]|nr:glycosyltransferase [bacterium]
MFLPLNFGDIVQRGVEDSFRDLGCELNVFDYFSIYESNRRKAGVVRQQFVQRVSEFRPDLIHMQVQHTTIIDDKTVLQIKRAFPKTIIVNWTGDVRNAVPDTFKSIGRASDYNLISSTGQLEMFNRAIGKPVQYLQIGYDPKLYYPDSATRTEFEWDCVFIANNNTKEGYPGRHAREVTCKLLQAAFGSRFALFGHGWPKNFKSRGTLDQKKAASAYHRSLCSISVSHYNELDHYFSDRLLMCLASGRPTIALEFPKWDSYFTNNCDLIIATSPEDIVSKVKSLKNNIQLANYIGKSGAEKVLAEHTYLSRMRELLDMVNLKN